MLTSAFQKSFGLQVHFRRLSFGGVSTKLGSCVVVIRQHLGGQVCGNVQILCAGCHFLSLNWKIYPEQSHSTCSYTLFLFSILIWFTSHNKCFILTVITANLHKDVDHQDIVVFQCLHPVKCKAFVWGFLFCASLDVKQLFLFSQYMEPHKILHFYTSMQISYYWCGQKVFRHCHFFHNLLC